MIRHTVGKLTSMWMKPTAGFAAGEGAEFLEMVEKYFDKAGRYTKIRPDILNFYKKADNVVKFNLTLIRGTSLIIKMMTASKSYQPIDANIKLINFPPREELGTQKMSILLKSRPWHAS